MEPTEAQMSRAHAAFNAESARWVVRSVNNYGLKHDTWILERVPSLSVADALAAVDDVAAYRYDGPDAKDQALFVKRDKCLREVLRELLQPTVWVDDEQDGSSFSSAEDAVDDAGPGDSSVVHGWAKVATVKATVQSDRSVKIESL